MSRLVEEIESIGVDELHIGREVVDPEERMSVPDEEELESWEENARELGVDEDLLSEMSGGYTGAVAVLNKGEGPIVGFRADIDALFITESEDGDHHPTKEEFRSKHEGLMHACGHDAHMTIALGILEAIKESDFGGTFKLFLQPAEEKGGGGKPMAMGDQIQDVEYLLGLHIGLDHPSGEVIAGITKPLANTLFVADIKGETAHAGAAPEEGRNAIQALGAAIENTYSIPRHSDGMTRVNIGRVEGGTASNIIADHVQLEAETRGETTELMEYMFERTKNVLQHSAEMHDCELSIDITGQAPRADSDEELVNIIHEIAKENDNVDNPVQWTDFGGSEDVTYLMDIVKENGGKAAYSIIGTDHPTGHHTSTFDIDENSMRIGIETMAESIVRISKEQP